ncbi:MAG: hypothetical protein IJP74_11020 [Prevotella sp.]|nr:hypothetical protein [Prevotella sp.]
MPEASDRGSQPYSRAVGTAKWLATPIMPLWGIEVRAGEGARVPAYSRVRTR